MQSSSEGAKILGVHQTELKQNNKLQDETATAGNRSWGEINVKSIAADDIFNQRSPYSETLMHDENTSGTQSSTKAASKAYIHRSSSHAEGFFQELYESLSYFRFEMADPDQEMFPQDQLDQFDLFPQLPIELRLRIWNLALPQGRYILLDPYQPLYERRISLPAVLYVSRESRSEALKKIMLIKSIKTYPKLLGLKSKDLVINTENDTVVIPAHVFSEKDEYGAWLENVQSHQPGLFAKVRSVEICFDRNDVLQSHRVMVREVLRLSPDSPELNGMSSAERDLLLKVLSYVPHFPFKPILAFKNLESIALTHLRGDELSSSIKNGFSDMLQIQHFIQGFLEVYCGFFLSGKAPQITIQASNRSKSWKKELPVAQYKEFRSGYLEALITGESIAEELLRSANILEGNLGTLAGQPLTIGGQAIEAVDLISRLRERAGEIRDRSVELVEYIDHCDRQLGISTPG